MLDFKIKRGLSTELFSEPGVVNPKLIVELGCWYLCTDTAELFVGELDDENSLTLKRVNDDSDHVTDEHIIKLIDDYYKAHPEQDPTIYEWAKRPTKPAYTSSEVGAVSSKRKIAGIDLVDDITVEELQKVLLKEETDPTVPDWAKQSEKPTYTATEVGAVSLNRKIAGINLTKDITAAQLQEALGFITGFDETDPTVPDWAKQPNKPEYTTEELGAVPVSRKIAGVDLTTDISVEQLQSLLGVITSFEESDPTVPAWAKVENPPTYSADDVGAVPKERTLADIPLTNDITKEELWYALQIAPHSTYYRPPTATTEGRVGELCFILSTKEVYVCIDQSWKESGIEYVWKLLSNQEVVTSLTDNTTDEQLLSAKATKQYLDELESKIDSMEANDSNTKTIVATEESSDIVVTHGYDSTTDTHTYTLGLELPDVPEYSISKEVSEGQAVYTLLKDASVVGNSIVVPDAYNDTDLVDRVEALELNNHVSDIIYDTTTHKIYLTERDGGQIGNGFDAPAFIKDGMVESVTLVDNKLIITWNSDVDIDNNGQKDVTEINLSDLIDVYEAGKGIKISGRTITIDEQLVATVEALNEVRSIASSAQTAEQVQNMVASALASYVKTTDLEAQYATIAALTDTDNIAKDAQSRVGIVETKIDGLTAEGGEPNVLERIKVNGVTQTVSNKEVDISIPTTVSALSDGQSLTETVNSNKATVENHTARLDSLAATDASLLAAIQQNTAKFLDYSTTEQIASKISADIAAIDLSEYVTGDDITSITSPLAERVTDLEEILSDAGNIKTQFKSIDDRLAVIEGDGTGSINKALTDSKDYADQAKIEIKSYVDAETLKDRNRLAALEFANDAQNSLITSNTDAISKEVSDRATAITEAINSISNILGENYSTSGTVAMAIADAKQAGTNASSAVSNLINGQVATNTTNIQEVGNNLAKETTARENADIAFNTRLERVETFFEKAENETVDDALDTLVEIQKFITEEGTAADEMLKNIQSNIESIEAIQEVIEEGGTLESRVATAETTIQQTCLDVESLKKVTGGYTTEKSIQNAINTVENKAEQGISDAATAKGIAEQAVASIATTNSALSELDSFVTAQISATSQKAEAAQDQADINTADITSIKANYIHVDTDTLFIGEDTIIFNCGSAADLL